MYNLFYMAGLSDAILNQRLDMNLGLISTLLFKTALHWAAKNGQIEMVDFLLAQGDGVNTEMRTV